jgi:hypothetical protein
VLWRAAEIAAGATFGILSQGSRPTSGGNRLHFCIYCRAVRLPELQARFVINGMGHAGRQSHLIGGPRMGARIAEVVETAALGYGDGL